MRWLALLLMLFLAPDVFATLAQQPVPTARQDALISVDDAGLLVFAGEGDALAVSVGQRLQLYDLSEPVNPHDLVTLELPERPLALGATEAMTLVAIERETGAGEILVVAPDRYRGGLPGFVNSLQTAAAVTGILVSPDRGWAVVLSEDGYSTLRLTAPNIIESSALVRTPDTPVAGALLDDALLLAQSGTTRVDRLPLRLSPGLPAAGASLAVDAPVTALAVTPDGSLGAAVLEDDELIMFDPDTMARLGSQTLEDGPVVALHLMDVDGRQILLAQIANRPAVMLLDVTDADAMSLLGSAGTGANSPVIAADASGSRMALASRERVVLLTLD